MVSIASYCNLIEPDDHWDSRTDCAPAQKIEAHMNAAFDRIKLASGELAKIARGANDANSDVKDAAGYLFVPIQFAQVSERLARLYDNGRTGYISTRTNDKTQDGDAAGKVPGQNDVVGIPDSEHACTVVLKLIRSCNQMIYCTKNRWIKRTAHTPPLYEDQVWTYAVPEKDIQQCFDTRPGLPRSMAFTTRSKGTRDSAPDVMQICPWYVRLHYSCSKRLALSNRRN